MTSSWFSNGSRAALTETQHQQECRSVCVCVFLCVSKVVSMRQHGDLLFGSAYLPTRWSQFHD